jgi:hypothetical protein
MQGPPSIAAAPRDWIGDLEPWTSGHCLHGYWTLVALQLTSTLSFNFKI